MGEVEINVPNKQLIIHSVLFFYGDAATDELSSQVAQDIAAHWNAAAATEVVQGKELAVIFKIEGIWSKRLTPQMVQTNQNPRNNYFRIEEYVNGNISFVDDIHSNTGYFKLDNLLNHSTTAAHEYGHSLGLVHPDVLDIRGKGAPGIMYPRGTLVDPDFQYDPGAKPLGPGGTMNPFSRKVLTTDIYSLRLNKLRFNKYGLAVLGAFSGVWHEKHLPG